MQPLTYVTLHTPSDLHYAAMEQIFFDSFPANERRPLSSLHQIMAEDARFHCEVALLSGADCKDCVVGFISYWVFPAFVYIEYLATRSDLRGRSLGSQILQHLLCRTALPIVLEAELPAEDLSRRRIAFYERMGFVMQPDAYMQPSYGVIPGLPLCLLRLDRQDREIATTQMITVLHREVYGVK